MTRTQQIKADRKAAGADRRAELATNVITHREEIAKMYANIGN